MRVEIIKCDRCEKTSHYEGEGKVAEGWRIVTNAPAYSFDLCPKCGDDLDEFMQGRKLGSPARR